MFKYEQDEKAFDEFCKFKDQTPEMIYRQIQLNAWEACCEYKDKQAAQVEPVGEVAQINGSPIVYWDKSLPVGTKLYTEVPAVAQGVPEAFVRVESGKIVGHSVHDEMVDGVYELHFQGSVQPTVAVNEKIKSTLENVALIAHHGGLIDLSESDALFLIRKITRSWNNPKPDPRQKKKLLLPQSQQQRI